MPDQTFAQRIDRKGVTSARAEPGLLSRSDTLLLKLAIENMAQGLFMLDADQRIIVLNQQFLDIYSLPGFIIRIGATAQNIVEQSVLVGNYPGRTFEEARAAASLRIAARLPWRVQQRLGNGRMVEIAFSPMQDGGWVTTHLDVTERQDAGDRLAYRPGTMRSPDWQTARICSTSCPITSNASCRWPSSASTRTDSRPSTTISNTHPATSCCARLPTGSARACAEPIRSPASAETSS